MALHGNSRNTRTSRHGGSDRHDSLLSWAMSGFVTRGYGLVDKQTRAESVTEFVDPAGVVGFCDTQPLESFKGFSTRNSRNVK